MTRHVYLQALKLQTRLAIRAHDAFRRFRHSGSVMDFEQWLRLDRLSTRASRRAFRRFVASKQPTDDVTADDVSAGR